MELTVLGSGGNTTIPTPTCSCDVCEQARCEGIPYSRGGNSLYLPELSALVDAPEFVFEALNRDRVSSVDHIFLTHWHPDHVNGLRIVQARDKMAYDSYVESMAEGGPTIVTTHNIYERTCDVFGQLEFFVEETELADVHFIDDSPLKVGDVEVSAVPYWLEGADLDATAFVVDRGETTLLIASDDARHLTESDLPADIDLVVFECGLFDFGPDGDQILTDSDWSPMEILLSEQTTVDVIIFWSAQISDQQGCENHQTMDRCHSQLLAGWGNLVR